MICYICKEKNMYLRTCGSFKTVKRLGSANSKFTHYKSANHKKIRSANRKPAKCHICGRSANITNYLGSQDCRFVICGNYLRTAQRCFQIKAREKGREKDLSTEVGVGTFYGKVRFCDCLYKDAQLAHKGAVIYGGFCSSCITKRNYIL